jgi:hypothetical protein
MGHFMGVAKSGTVKAYAPNRFYCGSRTCKPNFVRLAAGRPFLWAAHYCAALATYPKV